MEAPRGIVCFSVAWAATAMNLNVPMWGLT